MKLATVYERRQQQLKLSWRQIQRSIQSISVKQISATEYISTHSQLAKWNDGEENFLKFQRTKNVRYQFRLKSNRTRNWSISLLCLIILN